MSTVHLHDGTPVDSASEAWRHECEARHVLSIASIDERRAYLAAVEKKRGAGPAAALRQLARDLWEKRRADR